jgi:hypothetical protein
MPLLGEGSYRLPDSKSFSRLVISGADSPSERWIIDPDLPGLFDYHYSGWTLPGTKVVIPKGSIVSVGAPVRDYRTLKYKPTLTFANGSNIPVGVAPFSYFRRFDAQGAIMHDWPEADDHIPSIITRAYIEVPYISNPTDVYSGTVTEDTVNNNIIVGGATAGMKFKWGCATNLLGDFGYSTTELKETDWVKPGPYGKFVKWVSGDDPRLRVGQVLCIEKDVPPEGWLNWVVPEVDANREDNMRDEHEIEPPLSMDGTYPYDPNFKWPLTSDYRSPGEWKNWNTGVPGLTDGKNMAATVRIRRANVPAITNATSADAVAFQLDLWEKGKIVNLKVFVGNTQATVNAALGNNQYSFDASTNVVKVGCDNTAGADAVTIEVQYQLDSLVGVIPAWDYTGSVGAVRILLNV